MKFLSLTLLMLSVVAFSSFAQTSSSGSGNSALVSKLVYLWVMQVMFIIYSLEDH